MTGYTRLRHFSFRYFSHYFTEISQVSDDYCGLEEVKEDALESYNGRRAIDHTTVGAIQACNHACPTVCTDAYEPACAEIWDRHSKADSEFRMMINHCHIDLFSCSTGLSEFSYIFAWLMYKKVFKPPFKYFFVCWSPFSSPFYLTIFTGSLTPFNNALQWCKLDTCRAMSYYHERQFSKRFLKFQGRATSSVK